MIDSARLITQLNITALQNTQPSLYQLLRELIKNQASLELLIGAIDPDGGGGSGSIVNNINQFLISGGSGEDGESGFSIPGPAGVNGATGAQGPQGVTLLSEDGIDGNDGFNIPNPGPQGTTGAQGPLGVSLLPMDGEDGLDGFGFPGPAGPAGSADGWNITWKAADTARVNNTLLADPDLQFPMLANKTYSFAMVALYTSTTAADFEMATVGPAAPTRVAIKRSHIPNGSVTQTNSTDEAYDASIIIATSTSGAMGWINMDGSIVNGANAGNFEFHWAQDTTQAGDLTAVYAGSWIAWKQVD